MTEVITLMLQEQHEGAEGGEEGGAEAPVQTGNADQGQGVPAGQPQAIQPPPMPSRTSP